jgi:hypothetical protein
MLDGEVKMQYVEQDRQVMQEELVETNVFFKIF